MEKKGAMELSISTIVVIVLAMAMLILGLVLVNSIFKGAKYNVDTINDKVAEQIGILLVGDKQMVIYLANQKVDIKQGNDWGVAFGVKNLKPGTSEGSKFSYTVEVANPTEVKEKCHINEKDAMSWIQAGKESNSQIAPGAVKIWIVRFQIPEGAPLCFVRYNINVNADNEFYSAESFDVKVVA